MRLLRLGAWLSGLALLLAGCAPSSPTPPTPTGAADSISSRAELKRIAAEFNPGLIISDAMFYDQSAMSVGAIQTFLETVRCVPRDGVPCLADYRETFVAQPDWGPGHCFAIPELPRASAAEIISTVAQACGVSPRTLLVLLQKEQSLLTSPSEYGYTRATGYGCPDTADCFAKYFGFGNQVYNAAWQFRQYTLEPERRYRIGTVDVAFKPDPACGAAPVSIVNQATANLYNYTPYQPNAAAIADPGGQGDACSAWGNLNMWLIWNVWFGDPLAEPLPDFFPACERHEAGARCELIEPTDAFEPPLKRSR